MPGDGKPGPGPPEGMAVGKNEWDIFVGKVLENEPSLKGARAAFHREHRKIEDD